MWNSLSKTLIDPLLANVTNLNISVYQRQTEWNWKDFYLFILYNTNILYTFISLAITICIYCNVSIRLDRLSVYGCVCMCVFASVVCVWVLCVYVCHVLVCEYAETSKGYVYIILLVKRILLTQVRMIV